MPEKIAISTSSFAKVSTKPMELVESSGCAFECNALGRTLKGDEIVHLLNDCDGVVAGTEQYDRSVIDQLPNLKVISRCGVGMDSIDLDYAKSRGVKIFNTPDGPTRAVAELVIGLALNLLRHVHQMDRQMRQAQWSKQMGSLFFGKTIGIIGFGRIGQAVCELSNLLGGKVLYFDPFVEQSAVSGCQRVEFEALLQNADIISIHLPFTKQTQNSVGVKEFGLMKKGAIFINCSRGGIVDEQALCEAVISKKLAGAAIDVFEEEPYKGPLSEIDNVILTPHIGSYAQEARVNMEIQAVENLFKGLKTGVER